MILLLDFGNTRLKWWHLNTGKIISEGAIAYSNIDEELKAICEAVSFRRVLISSVRTASFNNQMERKITASCGVIPEWASSTMESRLLSNGYTLPETLGVDRWVSMIGARSTYAEKVLIVASLGTAVTVDLIIGNQHHGGYIAPGFATTLSALSLNTDLINVEPDAFVGMSPGRNTRDCVINAFPCMIKGMINEVLSAQNSRSVKVILSGGDAYKVLDVIEGAVLDSRLIPRGICHLFAEQFRE